MSNRNWFYASEGQQKGPLPEAQLRDLIARGMVRADTLVWTEGMPGWQRDPDLLAARAIVLPRRVPLAELLQRSAEYRVFYEDQQAIVFTRK